VTQATTSGRVTVMGKQVKLDGAHLCDARDETAALAIRDALDFARVGALAIPPEALKNIMAVLL
jgi:hypothetical protein